MSVLNTVKLRLGITYTDPLKDSEIQSIIDGCIYDMISSGVSAKKVETPLGIDTIVLYAKMQLDTDADKTKINPVYLSNIVKLR